MKKRIAIVTGASSGIGKTTAALLRKQGFFTVGLSRRLNNSASTRRCDIRDESSVRKVFQDLAREHGAIHALVNAAGIASAKGSLDLTVADWEEMLRVNLIGTYLCCKYAFLSMRPSRYGKIVNVSSKAGRSCSLSASLAYTCSKYGVIGLTRQLAPEYARQGVNINCVCPSQVKTEMLEANVPKAVQRQMEARMPMGRFAAPAEIGNVIAFLLSDSASYLNGSIIDIHGAQV